MEICRGAKPVDSSVRPAGSPLPAVCPAGGTGAAGFLVDGQRRGIAQGGCADAETADGKPECHVFAGHDAKPGFAAGSERAGCAGAAGPCGGICFALSFGAGRGDGADDFGSEIAGDAVPRFRLLAHVHADGTVVGRAFAAFRGTEHAHPSGDAGPRLFGFSFFRF